MQASVIIPCFNCERYLGAAIESVLAQTSPVEQIIVVDDGSTDCSAEVARSFRSTGKVTLLQQDHRGVSEARNTGIAVADGNHVLFLDADDILHPEAVEHLAACGEMDPGAVAIMGCATFREDLKRPSSTTIPVLDGDFFPRILRGNIGPVHTLLIPTDLMRRVGGFRAGMRFFEDWECMARIALLGAKLAPTDFVGAYYRRHSVATFARSRPREVAEGHIRVMETLCSGMFERKNLLQAHGESLFWATWTALRRGRAIGLSWTELQKLGGMMDELVRQGPPGVRRSRYSQIVRLLGFRWADRLVRAATHVGVMGNA
jgi:glycosyltransferase involved in cell wall biosynthesis